MSAAEAVREIKRILKAAVRRHLANLDRSEPQVLCKPQLLDILPGSAAQLVAKDGKNATPTIRIVAPAWVKRTAV
jgi:hypothetical protein